MHQLYARACTKRSSRLRVIPNFGVKYPRAREFGERAMRRSVLHACSSPTPYRRQLVADTQADLNKRREVSTKLFFCSKETYHEQIQ